MFIFHGFGQVQSNNRFTIARKILIMVQFMSWIGLQKTHKLNQSNKIIFKSHTASKYYYKLWQIIFEHIH